MNGPALTRHPQRKKSAGSGTWSARSKATSTHLGASQRAQIDDAVTAVRRHRAVHLGMPAVRTVLPSPRTEASA